MNFTLVIIPLPVPKPKKPRYVFHVPERIFPPIRVSGEER